MIKKHKNKSLVSSNSHFLEFNFSKTYRLFFNSIRISYKEIREQELELFKTVLNWKLYYNYCLSILRILRIIH